MSASSERLLHIARRLCRRRAFALHYETVQTHLTARVAKALIASWFVLSAGEYAPLSACEAHRGVAMVLSGSTHETAREPTRGHALHQQTPASTYDAGNPKGASVPSHDHGTRCCCTGDCDSPPVAIVPVSPVPLEIAPHAQPRVSSLRESPIVESNHGVRLPPANGPPSIS
jgi:hypothetical protein